MHRALLNTGVIPYLPIIQEKLRIYVCAPDMLSVGNTHQKNCARWAAGPKASAFMTGAIIPVDGGLTVASLYM